MRLFTSIPVSVIDNLEKVREGIKPWGETANGHDAVLVSAWEFFHSYGTPEWVVEFEVSPHEVFLDLDDDNELLAQVDVLDEELEYWVDRSLAELWSRYPNVRVGSGYGLYVREVPAERIKRIQLQIIVDGDPDKEIRVTVFP